MKKCIFACLSILLFSLVSGLTADKRELNRNLIRFHVVGSSNSEADQLQKMKLKDALIDYLQPKLEDCRSMEEAHNCLQQNLQNIEDFSNRFLQQSGSSDTVKVSLEQEPFSIRHYETFSLPSGVYHSLRIQIGEAAGKNWWCVVFPSLCIQASGEDFSTTATGAGFSESLSKSLTGEDAYELEFFFLDCLGKLENFMFFAG